MRQVGAVNSATPPMNFKKHEHELRSEEKILAEHDSEKRMLLDAHGGDRKVRIPDSPEIRFSHCNRLSDLLDKELCTGEAVLVKAKSSLSRHH